ncbi:MAG TPA: hypothetical protein VGI92_10510 [Gemmatimonadales bacterium]|jgi:hypothetical protein
MSFELLFLHITGVAIWLGAGFTFMIFGPAAKRMPLESWANVWITLAAVQRRLIIPACIVTIVTGIIMTMQMVTSHAGVSGSLLMMQAFGVVAAGITIAVSTPLAARMARLARRSQESGTMDPGADRVRKALAIAGSISGVLVLGALFFGVSRF